jgi:hypothetical protein
MKANRLSPLQIRKSNPMSRPDVGQAASLPALFFFCVELTHPARAWRGQANSLPYFGGREFLLAPVLELPLSEEVSP